jgi:hypothetical protein
METMQGNSLCSYLYLKLGEIPGFSFKNWRSVKLEGGLAPVDGGRWQGKG